MQLTVTAGGRQFACECFDNEASKLHFSNIIMGKTYARVPFVNEVRTILDIGANIGAASVYFALLYPEARILAVEPSRDAFALLQRNVAGFANVRAFNFGLHSKAAKVPLYKSWVDSVTASVGKSFLNTQEYDEIELRPVRDWRQENVIAGADILKIDTEGCEVPILREMSDMLGSVRVIYVEYHSDEDRRTIDDMLRATHVIWRGKIEHAHCGELVYVHKDADASGAELHRHRISVAV
jgi:FkbM family methyltransferase